MKIGEYSKELECMNNGFYCWTKGISSDTDVIPYPLIVRQKSMFQVVPIVIQH